jgi:uncharacterized RDD family membrane protein YckC
MTQGNPPQDQRYAPPAAHVEDVEATAEGEQVLATRWQRFWAVIVDVVVGLTALWLIGLATSWDPFGVDADASLWDWDLRGAAIGFISFVVLHGYLLATRGQTIGKLVLGIRIVRSEGGRASLGRLIGLRYGIGSVVMLLPALGSIYALVDALLIFRESRRCLHDNIADTIVVKA